MSNGEHKAKAEIERADNGLVLKVGGTWRLTDEIVSLETIFPAELKARRVEVKPVDLAGWDTSLPLFLMRVREWCRQQGGTMDIKALPDALQQLFRILSETGNQEAEHRPPPKANHRVAGYLRQFRGSMAGAFGLIGESVIAMAKTPAHPRHFSWRDLLAEMAGAGPKALPIVGILSFLIGLTFAYETAMQLRRFGADAFVVQAVGVAVVRQTGPMIVAMVLAGRTGAAFAARIADMKLQGELDALNLLGVSPVQYLVLPRLLALSLMTPLMTLYADLFGVLGGLAITTLKLDLPAIGFFVKLQETLSVRDLSVGLIKSVVFGAMVALAGTWRGLESERSSVGVGRAVTSAVVTGITAIICADALFAPILKNLNF